MGSFTEFTKKPTEAAVFSAWEMLGFSLQDIDILAQGWLHKKDHCNWKPSPPKVSFILFPLNLSAPWPYVEFLELASQFQLSSSVVELELQKDTAAFLNSSFAETHPGQLILSSRLGRASKTFVHHFKSFLLRTCLFRLLRVCVKFTFPRKCNFQSICMLVVFRFSAEHLIAKHVSMIY